MSESAQAKATHSSPQQRELPSDWRWVRLEEVCKQDRQIVESFSDEADALTYFSLEHIEAETGRILRAPTDQVNDEGKSTTFRFDERHVLYGKLRPYLNKVALPNAQGRCTTEMIPLIPLYDTERDFLAWLLRRRETVDFAMQGKTGSRMPRADMDSLLKLSIPFPPLSEQRRIAGLLREQVASVETARTAAQARLEAVKSLPAAFLRQVFPQPGQPLPDGWRWVRLGEVCRDISDGTHFTPTYVSEGVPFLSVKDVREKRLSFTDCRYITKEQHLNFCRRCKPEKGDVLYTKVGTTGIAKAIDIDVEFSIFVSVALLKLQSTIIPNYLEKVLNAPVCRTQAENLTQGMANRNLVLKDLKLIILPIPPLDEQERIAAELSGQMASVENARMAAQEELNTINALPAALLRRAFAGEL